MMVRPYTRAFSRRGFLTAIGAAALAGCAGPAPEPPATRRPTSLVDAFLGANSGIGVFSVPLTGLKRRFTARLNGVLTREGLDVAEDFVFDDGERDHLTWRFRRLGAGRWEGRREDTVGVASVVEFDGVIRLDYVADIRSGGNVTRLGFSDLIYRRADGVVINEGSVSRLGVPIGSVHFELRRA